jgi:hypothetical protein
MMNWQWKRKNVLWLVEVLYREVLGVTEEKKEKTSVRIAYDPIDIQNKHLPDTLTATPNCSLPVN